MFEPTMKNVILSDGKRVPTLGQSAALCLGIQFGMSPIDTMAIYGAVRRNLDEDCNLALSGLSPDGQKSDSQAGEDRGRLRDERGQLRMRGFEFFNGLF
jgi:hypothetical protein